MPAIDYVISSIPRSGQGVQSSEAPGDEGFLLRAGPAFELGLAGSGSAEGGDDFDAEEGQWRIFPRREACMASEMIVHALDEIGGRADVEHA